MSDNQVMNFCRQLSDFDSSVRRFAVKKLIKLPNPVAIPYLIDILDDPDIFVKTNAENALYNIGEVCVPQLVECFTNQNAEVKLRALSIYRRLNTSDKLEKLIPLISDPDQDVKSSALIRLQKGLSLEASRSLWNLVKKTNIDDDLRELASQLLEKNVIGIEDEIIQDINEANLDLFSKKLGSKLFVKLNPAGHEIFLNYLDSDIPEMRISALISTSKLKPNDILSLSIKATNNENGEVRKVAVQLIGKYGTEKELQLLNELKNTPSIGVWKVSKQAIEDIESRLN